MGLKFKLEIFKKKNFAYANNILITQPFLAEDSTTHQNKFITEFIISDEVASWQGTVVRIKCYHEKAKTINFGQSIAIVPKINCHNIWLCVDMKSVNEANIQEQFQISTLEEVIHEFNSCTLFTNWTTVRVIIRSNLIKVVEFDNFHYT